MKNKQLRINAPTIIIMIALTIAALAWYFGPLDNCRTAGVYGREVID